MSNVPVTSTPAVHSNLPQRGQTLDQHFIVVHDPKGEYWEGSIVDANRARQLIAHRSVVLPVAPTLFHVGNGGYSKRAWGAGYPIGFNVPRMLCPLALFCTKEFTKVNWAARLVVEDELLERVKRGEKLEGMLRFAADTGSPTPHYATYSSEEKPLLINALGKPDVEGGWTIGGSGKINIPIEGHYGFALYGMAPGIRVQWSAAALSAAA